MLARQKFLPFRTFQMRARTPPSEVLRLPPRPASMPGDPFRQLSCLQVPQTARPCMQPSSLLSGALFPRALLPPQLCLLPADAPKRGTPAEAILALVASF